MGEIGLADNTLHGSRSACIDPEVERSKVNTHTHRFTALLEYVRDYPGEQVPETRKVKPGRLKPIWIYWSKR